MCKIIVNKASEDNNLIVIIKFLKTWRFVEKKVEFKSPNLIKK